MSDEDTMRVEQLDYFEKVLENSMATSEERVEQFERTRMQSDAMDENSNRIHSSREKAEQQHYARKDFNKPRDAE